MSISRLLYHLREEPKFCPYCGDPITRNEKVIRCDPHTGKATKIRVGIRCSRWYTCAKFHGYLYHWTEKPEKEVSK